MTERLSLDQGEDNNLNRGDYTEAWERKQEELANRTDVILRLGSTATEYIVPVDPMDLLQCESCQ